MDGLNHVLKKYNIKTEVIEIPNADRTDLAQLFHELDFKVGAEIGVAAGKYSEIMMEANPQLHQMYGIDPHESYRGYRDYTRGETFNRLLGEAHERLDRFPNYAFIRDYSVPVSKSFADGSLDFVYIDGNHSEPYVTQDIEAWAPKVRSGGIVAGDDYARIRGKGDVVDSQNWAVIPAITKYIKDRDLQLFIWGLEAKLPGLKRDASRSWMFFQS